MACCALALVKLPQRLETYLKRPKYVDAAICSPPRLLAARIEVNVAALDFDHDDTPELGVAGVLSLLRDYVQFGAGYNLGTDNGYWFFGLRLPAPAFTLGGVENIEAPPGAQNN